MEILEENRRAEPRRRVLKTARIVFKNHTVTFDCVVRNLSDGGASLKVESSLEIPDSFDLVIATASIRSCRVAWRKATEIGVEFAKTMNPTPHQSGTSR
ncbi:MAG TPA: PilZ domain-containing protein [Methylocella sp.]|jgi:PilZ domain|nr:PilZ domain-containing protein [Methylocella sp.]